MSLAQRTENLIAELNELEQTKILASQANHFESRAGQLCGLSEELVSIAKVIQLLRVLNIKFNSLSEVAISDWNYRFSKLQSNYDSNPQSILDPSPGEDFRAVFLNPLKELPRRIKALVTVEWTSWASREIPTINDDLIGVLSTVDSMKVRINELRTLKRSVIEASNRMPDSQSDINQFQKNIKSIRQSWGDLAGDEIPIEVIEFLRSAGRPEGADISQLTPKIHEWFSHHNLTQSIRIRVA